MAKPGNQRAFPSPINDLAYSQPGMTLRDYFAGQALTGIIANRTWPLGGTYDEDACEAYILADAMIEERE